jgi:hypothetical protein
MNNFVEVTRRYTSINELRQLLCIERPGCIVPPIPSKSTTAKLKSADSDENVERRLGI